MPTNMNALMRKRRQELEDLPAYEGPPSRSVSIAVKTAPDSETETEETELSDVEPQGLTVIAPGEESTGDGFEYEPSLDAPGAWIVYPPGVPCDDSQYRVQMSRPAGASDFDKMQQALADAGATTSGLDMMDEDDEDDEEAY